MSVEGSPSRRKSGRRLDVTHDAEDDIRSILEYSHANWGVRQRDMYGERLVAAMNDLTRFPHFGRDRDDLSPGLRSRVVEQHVIYYRVDVEAVTIIRVLHGRIDVAAELG